MALKVIRKKNLGDNDEILREIETMRQLEHKNIVRLLDAVELEIKWCLVQEYCGGGDLQQHHYNRGKQLPEAEVKHIIKQLADGLSCMHSHALIHRDLKPENLLLTADIPFPLIKIADFGTVKNIKTQRAMTYAGTKEFMAPEMHRHNGPFDIKTDLWSIGVIMVELFTGDLPFINHDWEKTLHTASYQFPDNFQISEECQQFIQGLLQPIRKKRFNFLQFINHPFLKDEVLST